nr:MAG TPA: hypothetical protein [Caudoviricetes sp.]
MVAGEHYIPRSGRNTRGLEPYKDKERHSFLTCFEF